MKSLDLSNSNLHTIPELPLDTDELQLDNNYISNLSPLANLVNLTELSLDNNHISN